MKRVTMTVLVALMFVGCSGADATHSSSSGDSLSGPQLFTLKDTNGNTVSLEAELAKHKAVLLNFWATWCPPCREEIPDLIKLQEKYGENGFTILGVDIGESQKKASSFIGKIGINYPVLLDGDEEVAGAYGIVGIPTSLLIKSDKTILGEYHSASKKLFSDVEKAVQ